MYIFIQFFVVAEDLHIINNEQLIDVIKNLMEEVKLLKVENELNERFLGKNDPELLNGIMAATLETEKRKTTIKFADSVHEHITGNDNVLGSVQTPVTGNSSEISRSAGSNAGSAHSRAESIVSSVGTSRGRHQANLSFVIKSEICEAECKLEQTDLDVFEQNMRSQFCQLLAETEEIKLATKDVIHATEMFSDFVIAKGKAINNFNILICR